METKVYRRDGESSLTGIRKEMEEGRKETKQKLPKKNNKTKLSSDLATPLR